MLFKCVQQPEPALSNIVFEDGPKAIIKAAELRKDCPARLFATVLKYGMGVSKRLLAALEQDAFRNEFLEVIMCQSKPKI